jgi:hypothetical protein
LFGFYSCLLLNLLEKGWERENSVFTESDVVRSLHTISGLGVVVIT